MSVATRNTVACLTIVVGTFTTIKNNAKSEVIIEKCDQIINAATYTVRNYKTASSLVDVYEKTHPILEKWENENLVGVTMDIHTALCFSMEILEDHMRKMEKSKYKFYFDVIFTLMRDLSDYTDAEGDNFESYELAKKLVDSYLLHVVN